MDRIAYELGAAGRAGEQVAVLFCDLDAFKAVNDGAGHAAGDEVIIEIARRLSDSVRPADTVGRLSGDEFVIVCPGVGLPAAQAIARRISQRVEAEMVVRGRAHELGVSIGIGLSYAGQSAQELLEQADQAMYVAKGDRVPEPRRRTPVLSVAGD
jgi:diguanylate cyclase (GGDEF)-like protein